MPKLVGFSKFILARRESSIYRAVGEWIDNINRFNLTLCVCMKSQLFVLSYHLAYKQTLDVIPSNNKLFLMFTIKCFFKICLQKIPVVIMSTRSLKKYI